MFKNKPHWWKAYTNAPKLQYYNKLDLHLSINLTCIFLPDTADSRHSSPTVSIPVHSTSTSPIYGIIASTFQTLPAQSNIMPSRTSLVIYSLPTSTVQDSKKSLPSVQPSSTERVLRITETLQPMSQSNTAAPPRLTESFWPTPRILHDSTASLRPELPGPTPTAGSPLIILDLQTIGIIAGAAAFVAIIIIIVIVVVAVMVCKRNKPKKGNVKRVESMVGNAAYEITLQNDTAATRAYRHGDTYDYPRFGNQLLKSVKGKGMEIQNGTAVRLDNTYTTVMTFTLQENEAHVTSPTTDASDLEDFEHNMQTNEAYVATPTSTRDFEHSMQINEAYVATPTSANGGFEHSLYEDDETYENYVTNNGELDEYSYVRYVHR